MVCVSVLARVHRINFTMADAVSPASFDVFATGLWRKKPEWFDRLQVLLGDKFKLTLLTQEDEAIKQANCARVMMSNLIDLDDGQHVLFMGAGRGSTQFVLMTPSGDVVEIKLGSGYPKGGPPPVGELTNLLAELSRGHCDSVGLVVAFDSFYHICKTSCPVVPDSEYLPESVVTTCSDFADALDILPASWADKPMIVVRNFKVTVRDDLCKIGHLTTFKSGDGRFDLGSGRVAVVNPLNGQVLYGAELPAGWIDDESSLPVIADLIRAGELFVKCG